MELSKWKLDQIKIAKNLVIRAAIQQAELSNTKFASEEIPRSIPVVWFGDPAKNNWVTIATNPSTREFLNKDDFLLQDKQARFFIRAEGVSLQQYYNDNVQLESTINSYRSYFNNSTTYTGWFGKKKNAGKLEGLLNGMGGSFYNHNDYKRVVHTDFYPISTMNQMSKILNREELLESNFAKDYLFETLAFLEPSLIIVLGREHCLRFERMDGEFQFGEVKVVKDYPGAKYQINFNLRLGVPILGLHFKPSEVFIGLGYGKDSNNMKFGSYVRSEILREIGNEVYRGLKNQFPNWQF